MLLRGGSRAPLSPVPPPGTYPGQAYRWERRCCRPRCAPAKKAYARRKEEERWVKAVGEVKTVYRCICDKNLEMVKAEEHPKRIKTT